MDVHKFLESIGSAVLVMTPFLLVFGLVFAEIRKRRRKWAELYELRR